MTWKLETDEGQVELATAEQLHQQLLQLHEDARQQPIIVTLNAPDGSCLAIGLGRELSFLNYMAPGGWPAQHVIGSDENKGLINYMCRGHFSEMPSRYAVPLQDSLAAAEEFFKSGRLTEKLEWAND